MTKEIKKCPICGEAYYYYEGQEACPDCIGTANLKESRRNSQPLNFNKND